MTYKHRATFTTIASVVAPSDQDRFVAKASLDKLKVLLPAGVNPENDPDLLYIACNGAVAGLVNKNLDAIDNKTALAIHASAKNKYISTEHDREKVVGVILYPGLSKYGSDEPLTDVQAAELQEPFNMSFAGVLWKVVNPLLSSYIRQQGDSTGKDVLSMSWEIAFNDYDIGIGSRNLFDAKLIKMEDPSYAAYDKLLRQNGGKGTDASGQEVFRVINGNAIILGYSIVPNPAAEVSGIVPVTSNSNIQPLEPMKGEEIETIIERKVKEVIEATKRANPLVSEAVDQLAKIDSTNTIITSISEETDKKVITASDNSVNINTQKSMKIETIEQLETALAKHEAAAAAVDFVKAIKDASEKFAADLRAKEELYASVEKEKQKSEQTAKELKASLEKVQKELDEVKATQEASEANQKFQERMASLHERFDLDAEDNKLIASDIKDLDDVAFESYSKKCDKLMAAKSKKKGDDKDKSKKDDVKEEKKEGKKEESDEMKAAIASVSEIEKQAKVPNTVTVDKTMQEQMTAAFEGSIKIDGQTVAERKAAKATKAKK